MKITSKGYDYKTHRKLCEIYLDTGNMSKAAKLTKVSYGSALNWQKEPWFNELIEEIKHERSQEVVTKVNLLKNRALEVVEDRLVNGDYIYDQKTGETVRKPIGAHIASRVMKDTFDIALRREQMEMNKKVKETEEKITDRLLKLGEEFKKFAKSKEIKGEVIDDTMEENVQLQTSTKTIEIANNSIETI